MLNLPDVTLICLTNRDFEGHKKALDASCEGINFGAAKIIWDEGIQTIDDWNRKIIFDLWRYVNTDFALLFHADGYVIHPELWNDDWLEYDYIGAPWPVPKDDFSYYTSEGELVRVGNSVSLRSKELMRIPSRLDLPWGSYFGNTNEDGYLCVHNRGILKQHGIKFAPLEVAKYFSKEHEIEENKGIDTFAFHSL